MANRAVLESLLTLPEVADELRVSVGTLRNWQKQGYMDVVRLPGGTVRVTRSELRRLSGEPVVEATQAPQVRSDSADAGADPLKSD